MVKHTPGPWEIVYGDDKDCQCMTCIAPKGVFSTGHNVGRFSDHTLSRQSKIIAITFHQLPPYAGFEIATDNLKFVDIAEANAKLIAKAPEMFETLIEMSELISDILICYEEEIVTPLYYKYTNSINEKAKKIIAEIEG